ncbi:MAG: SpoIIE family protein phosphatase [Acidobacteria bacterium]|nr:SpoIIE family protein phosphatase [Acidobacteriota bacterium]
MSKTIEAKNTQEEISRKIAEDAIRARFSAMAVSYPIDLKPYEIKQDQCHSGITAIKRYKWRWPTPSFHELELQSVLTVRGETLVGDKVEAILDGDFAKKYLHAKSILYQLSIAVYILIVVLIVIFGIYRFVQRAQQKEVSYTRVFLLTLVFGGVGSVFSLLTDVALFNVSVIPDFPAPDWIIHLIALMSNLMLGLFFGFAYGSGEGDIREAYPGKLSSLDALITGKIFSRNVARSVLVGWAFGGWILLCANLVTLPWQGLPTSGDEFGPVHGWLGLAPSLFALSMWPTDVIMIVVIGLLIPLPFFHRRFKSPKIIAPLLALFMWIACARPYIGFRPHSAILVTGAVIMIIALIAFFQFDLLTTIVGLALPTFIFFSTALIAQPSPSLRRSGIISLAIALVALVIESFFAFKGQTYREEQVRPIYAKYLAERLSMQAEVSAAREAQKRLMPNFLPRTSHFSIAASCVPAFEVGGDFYDLFEMGSGRLGILIAEGGGKGLASALSIAFAKGFVMPKVAGRAYADNSPTEVIRGLQDRLMTQMGDEAGIGFMYAIIDATDGTLRYARTGSHPSVLVAQESSPHSLVSPQENVLKFKSNLGSENDVGVTEGSIQLGPGDSLIFFTDGIVKNLADNKATPDIEFTKMIANRRNESEENLQEALRKSINECSKHARKRGIEDDMTAVIVRLKKHQG